MIELPDLTSIDRIADWVELSVIYKNKTFSKARISSLLSNTGDDVDEATVDSIMSELIRRGDLYGDASPFIVEGKCVKPRMKWKMRPEIVMCLIFSIRGVRKKKGKDDGTKLFERLSSEAVMSYLNGSAEVIGFPDRKKLEEQIKNISLKTCERSGGRCPLPQDKDKGVDIIAWKPHGDKRPNQIILLVQCAAGINFEQKRSISLLAWNEFINWSVPPIQGITIPCIPSNDGWIQIRDYYHLIFDRVRIYRAIHRNTLSDRRLRREILAWCRNNLN
jgi:hypothetical protein